MVCRKLHECCKNEQYACQNKKNCLIYRDYRKKAVCAEKKKRYNLINDKNQMIALYHVDGGMIFDEENVRKCDFLYIVYDQDNPTAVFVELKGGDIVHAIQQLTSSIALYGTELRRRICARVICSSVPRLYNDPIVKNMKKDLMKKYKGTLSIYEKNVDERYSTI